jgi:hypothetical protein
MNSPIFYGKTIGRLKGMKLPPDDHYFVPHNLREFYDYCVAFALWLPIYALIISVNILLFLYKIPLIYLDLLTAKKKIIYFNPEAYSPPELSECFLKTGYPKYPFFQINYEQYCEIDSRETYSLEISRFERILLAVKDNTGKNIVAVM